MPNFAFGALMMMMSDTLVMLSAVFIVNPPDRLKRGSSELATAICDGGKVVVEGRDFGLEMGWDVCGCGGNCGSELVLLEPEFGFGLGFCSRETNESGVLLVEDLKSDAEAFEILHLDGLGGLQEVAVGHVCYVFLG